jgi:hypothetical protein
MNMYSLEPCILVAPYYAIADPYIYNCSFENIHSYSPKCSCIELYHSHSNFNFSDCLFRNISSLSNDGAGAIYLNMDGTNDVFLVSGNEFINITSTKSVFNMDKNSLFLVFEKTTFANISVEQNGGVFIFIFFIFFFFSKFSLILLII